jgi:hypothetical protein
VVLFGILAAQVFAAPQKKKDPPAHATILGTVFRDPGFALPEAKVTLFLLDDSAHNGRRGKTSDSCEGAAAPCAQKAEPKPKKLDEAISNYRGEYRFEVPAAEAKYVVRATLKGFKADEKEISISGEDRIEATLVLVPESKK